MNLYCLVEGRGTEKKVYLSWLAHVFPELQRVDRIEDVQENHLYLISGNGYPAYLERIVAALNDIEQHGRFDAFLICVDTEEFSIAQKQAEMDEIIAQGVPFAQTHVILQNCCMDTWFLGNTKVLRRNPQSATLREFKRFYDVSVNDPEAMGYLPQYETRAQFHYTYLKEMLAERGLKYSKSKPRQVQARDYLDALVTRHHDTGHLATFGQLVTLWRRWGGQI